MAGSRSAPTIGLYRIRVVSEMTGVPAPTLRAWERRYGVPEPQRTDSSYRLYSDEDIEIIRQLRDLCDQGVSPAEGARMLKARLSARSTSRTYPSVGRAGTPQDQATLRALTPAPRAQVDPASSWSGAVHRIVDAVKAFEPDGLSEATRLALCLGPARMVFEQVFVPALREIGALWHEGRITVAHEHLASEHLVGVARDLLKLIQPSAENRVALLACFEEELHVLPLYGAALYFVEWGFRTVVLGARTPPDALAEAVRNLDPTVVGLSVTLPPSQLKLDQTLEAYAAACGDRPWVVGGAGTGNIRGMLERKGAIVVGEHLEELPGIIEHRVLKDLAQG